MGNLVLSELGGQSRNVRRISEYLSRDNGESRLVDLTNMVPGHRSRAGDEPGSLRASRHRETVNVERAITDDRPIRTGNDLVDDDASRERLSGAILGDGQRQGERIAHLGFERPRDVVRNDGVVRSERTALSTRIHAWGIQRGRLGAGVNRVARSVLRREVELVEGVDGDQLVPRRHPVGEDALGNRHFLVRGRLRQKVGSDVLLDGRRRAVQGDRLDVGTVAEPRRGLVALGGRHVPERDRADRDNDRQRDEKNRRQRAPQALARITRGDAEYYSPSPHSCVESTHQILGAVSASRSLSESPRERSTMRPSRRKTVRSAHAAIRAS